MKTVNEVMQEVINSIGMHIKLYEVNVLTLMSEQVEDGIVVVSGDYDEDSDEVNLYFITSKNRESVFEDGRDRGSLAVRHEAIKTIKHEDVHRAQAADGLDTTLDKNLTREEYLMAPTEFEAYTLIDIPMDLEFYGSSYELDEYLAMGVVTREQFDA